MKRTIVIVVAVALGLLAIGASVAANQLKPVVIQQLGTALQSPVTVQAVGWRFPVGLSLRGLQADSPSGFEQPWLRLKAVAVQVAPWSLLWRRAIVADVTLVEPTIIVEQRADGRSNVPTFAQGGKPIWPRRLRITDGTVTYRDLRVSAMPIDLRIEQLRVTMDVTPALTVKYTASGRVADAEGREHGEFSVDGETARDQMTTAAATISHRALAALSPYLKPSLGTDVTAGQGTLTAKVRGKPEQVTADVHVEALGLALAPGPTTTAGVPPHQLVALLQDRDGRIQLDFTISGPWDRLQIQWDQVVASAVQQVLKTRVAQQMQDAVVRGAAQLLQPPPEGSTESLEDRFKQFGKQLEDSFKQQVREPPPAPDSTTTTDQP